MNIWMVIWVVLMMFWLFGGGYFAYSGPNQNLMHAGTTHLVPWCCVLILGLVQFGAVSNKPSA